MLNCLITFISLSVIYGLSLIQSPPQRKLPIITTINPKLTKYLAFGNENFFSDLNWLEFLQIATEEPFKENLKSPEFYILKKSVTLDNRNCIAYHQGGSFLSVIKNDVYGAEDLLLEGTKNCHYSGKFFFLLGYHYMDIMGQPKKAADAMLKASKFHDSPPHLAGLASRLYANTGNLLLSKRIVESMLISSQSELKKPLVERLKLLDMEIIMGTLTQVAQKFKKDTGKYPKDLQTLVNKGYLTHIPNDPTGYEWKVTKEGHVQSTNPRRYRSYKKIKKPN